MDLLTRATICAAAGVAFGFGPAAMHLAAIVPFALGPGTASRALTCTAAWAGAAVVPAGLAAFDYTGSVGTAAIAWTVPILVVTALVGGALAVDRRWRAVAVAAAVLAISVPPASHVTLVSPLPVAGLVFPGLGLVGLAGLVALLALASIVRPARAHAAVAGVALLSAAAAHAGARPDLPDGAGPVVPGGAGTPSILGIDTRRGMPDAPRAALFGPAWRVEERAAAAEVAASAASGIDAVLWPEGAYGEWTSAAGALLDGTGLRMIGGARVYVGADVYVNALVDGATGDVLYAQRRPVPLDVGGAHRAVSGSRLPSGARPDDGAALDALLCVELADPWLAATTFAAADGPVLWAANLGWSGRAGLRRRMLVTGAQWSALFDVPLVTAVNRPEPAAMTGDRTATRAEARASARVVDAPASRAPGAG